MIGTDGPVVERFRSNASVLYQHRQFVRERAARSALDGEMTNDLLLAVSEACANSMLHTASPTIRVSWSLRQLRRSGRGRRRRVQATGAHGGRRGTRDRADDRAG